MGGQAADGRDRGKVDSVSGLGQREQGGEAGILLVGVGSLFCGCGLYVLFSLAAMFFE